MTSLHPSSFSSNPSKNRNKIRSLSSQNLPSPSSTSLKSSSTSYPDLPSDPKRWSSSHVAVYLTYCLRFYPSAIVSDLARHVKEDSTLTGRKFLRLKEDQLRQMNFNERWIKLIMVGVKVLRREHLKGKILLNGGDIVDEEPDEMKIIEGSSEESGEEQHSSLTRNSFERNSSISSSTSSFSDNDLKNFLIPTSFSGLSSDDKEFFKQEFNKLKEFLKYNVEKEKNIAKFNELNRFIEKALSNIETNQENDHVKKDIVIEKETSKTTSSLFSLFLIDWLNNKWTKNAIFESGFVQGVMMGGIAVWTYMRYCK